MWPMPIFEVPVTALVEAATPHDAMSVALGDEPEQPGRLILGNADRPRELSAEEAAAKLGFVNELNAALSTPDARYETDPDRPGMKFSPAAAATLRRLRGSEPS
jgi:hypothetical protein